MDYQCQFFSASEVFRYSDVVRVLAACTVLALTLAMLSSALHRMVASAEAPDARRTRALHPWLTTV